VATPEGAAPATTPARGRLAAAGEVVAPPTSTRAEKRAGSRQRIIEATMGCLVTHGYAGTTTSVIAKASGLSQGALFNHFATKEELLAAVVESYHRRRIEAGLALAGMVELPNLSMAQVVEIVFAANDTPEALAIQELYVASRLVPRLRAACASVQETIDERNLKLAQSLFPEFADSPRFADVIAMFSAAVRGAAMVRSAFGPDATDQAVRRGLADALEVLADSLRAELGLVPEVGPSPAT
jgi:AcrR family transcriptional regulator